MTKKKSKEIYTKHRLTMTASAFRTVGAACPDDAD